MNLFYTFCYKNMMARFIKARRARMAIWVAARANPPKRVGAGVGFQPTTHFGPSKDG